MDVLSTYYCPPSIIKSPWFSEGTFSVDHSVLLKEANHLIPLHHWTENIRHCWWTNPAPPRMMTIPKTKKRLWPSQVVSRISEPSIVEPLVVFHKIHIQNRNKPETDGWVLRALRALVEIENIRYVSSFHHVSQTKKTANSKGRFLPFFQDFSWIFVAEKPLEKTLWL